MKTKTNEAARRYINTPAGGWGETTQAWNQLVDVAGSVAAADRATTHALLYHPGEAHSSRGESCDDAKTNAKRAKINSDRAAWGLGPLPDSAVV